MAKVSAQVVAWCNALFDLHREWTRQQGDAEFNPDEWPAENSVYNQHTLDVEAPPEALDEFHRKAREIFGG